MVTRVRLKWRLRLIIYLPTMPQLGVEDHMYQGVGGVPVRLTCADVHSRKEPLGFARYGGAVVRSPSTRSVAGRRSGDELRSLVHQAEAAIESK